jgi:chromosome partitioning protein
MIVTVVGFKGGVGKTTTAVHLAAYLQQRAPTMLVDGDPNRSAMIWGRDGKLPFRVVDERLSAKYAREYEHIIIDTQARPGKDDLKVLAEASDLVVLPTTPDALSLEALLQTSDELRSLGANSYRVLLTVVPPAPSKDGEAARDLLTSVDLPFFATSIRRFVAFQRAVIQGVPVYDVNDPRARDAWSDYERVGKEILP